MIVDYKIIASGSSGNCLLIDTLAIDIGVSYKNIKDELIESVYITHKHSDHVNLSTLKHLAKEGVKVFTPKCNKRWFKSNVSRETFTKIEFVDVRKTLLVQNTTSSFFIDFTKVIHDVPNFALNMKINYLSAKSGKVEELLWFHATDLASTIDLEAPNYHVYSLETNYCERRLDQLLRFGNVTTKSGHKFNRFNRTPKTHLSKQEALRWVNTQKGDKFIKTIRLHKSKVAYR